MHEGREENWLFLFSLWGPVILLPPRELDRLMAIIMCANFGLFLFSSFFLLCFWLLNSMKGKLTKSYKIVFGRLIVMFIMISSYRFDHNKGILEFSIEYRIYDYYIKKYLTAF